MRGTTSTNGDSPKATDTAKRYSLLTADQVGELLQVPKSWVYEQSRLWEQTDGRRGIPTTTLGRYRRYRPEAIYRWLERCEEPTHDDDPKGARR